ncbi:hypothetical protein PM082_002201 [Marasmius tenuissimus]|nr:hypothetical protein PM082_002201 [Marasmius tenuissimus]
MINHNFNLLDYAGLTILLALATLWVRSRIQGLPLPPGPRGYPVIGNLLDMPTASPGQQLAKMGWDLKTDVVYLNVAGSHVISLNSYEACTELLEKRSKIYSSRPHLPMLIDLMGWDGDFLMQPYGDRWKVRRKLFHHEFPVKDGKRHYSQQLKANRVLLKNLLDNPQEYREHIHHMSGSLILFVTYGIDAQDRRNHHVVNADKAVVAFTTALSPGAFKVDLLPWLKYVPSWLPGAGFKRKAREWRHAYDEMGREAYDFTLDAMRRGEAVPSFVSNLETKLSTGKASWFKQKEVFDTAATMYETGSDTTFTGLLTFILAMTCFPDYQKKAQAEIDSVIGQHWIPDFDDWDKARSELPYCEALMQEALRWEPLAPGGVMHTVEIEDEYRGYRIPKNASIIPNIWAIFHDEKMYPDPYTFKPDRWIKDGKINPDVRDAMAAFGFGRRVCPGKHFALLTTFITITTVLAIFDIEKAVGEDGDVIEPSMEFVDTLQHRPAPFPCVIKPRSKAHEDVLREVLAQYANENGGSN